MLFATGFLDYVSNLLLYKPEKTSSKLWASVAYDSDLLKRSNPL